MTVVLDANAAEALLFGKPGAEVVEAALLEHEAEVYIHLQNLVEVAYIFHQ